jgi:peroxiredoxin
MRSSLVAATVLVVLVGCNKKEPPPEAAGAHTTATTTAEAAPTLQSAAAPISPDAPPAAVGKPAPDFTLKDLDGNAVRLSSFKGKVVVLEWFNPGCPFVKRSHTKGSLVGTAAKYTKTGIVWLAVNSSASGKEGHGSSANRDAAKTFGMTHPILLDESGAVGKTYGATNTPHMFVIDDKGTLVYRGAIDNSPDGERESPTSGTLTSYVEEALASVAAGKPVATAETKAYGCSVKYAK